VAQATSSLSGFFFVRFSCFGMLLFRTVSTEEIGTRSSDHEGPTENRLGELGSLYKYYYYYYYYCGQLFITLFPFYYFFHVFHFNIHKEATFPVSVYIAPICASSSGSKPLKETCGVWDEGEQTFSAVEWEGGVGRRKTFCCLVALETAETNSKMS